MSNRPLPRRALSLRRQRIEADSVCGSHMGNGLCKLNPRLEVEVVDSVTVLVVVHIIRHAGRTTKHSLLLVRLDALSTTGDTTGSDSGFQEWAVVGAAIELDLGVVELGNVVEVACEFFLGLRGSGRAGAVERTPVTVIDLVSKVRAGHHIEVQEQPNLIFLSLRELGNIVCSAEESFLFSSPPREADRVLDAEFRELDGDLEDGN